MALIEFQNFSGGKNDSDVVSWPQAGHAPILSGAPGGGYYAHFNATDATTSGDGTFRVHNWGFPSGVATPVWFANGHVLYQTITIRVPATHRGSIYAGPEIHQSAPQRTGPAPFNGCWHDGIGTNWGQICRGNNNSGWVSDTFFQTTFGAPKTGWPNYPFVGGNKPVVADQWVSWIYGWLLDYQGKGWFECYMRRHGVDNDWVNVIPRKTGIYTSYNNTLYPMMSMYGSVGQGGNYQMDYCHGAFSDNLTEVQNFGNVENGFGDTPVPTPNPPPTPSSTTATSSVKDGDKLVGSTPWVVTVTGPGTDVEYFVNSTSLGKKAVTNGKATFTLDPSKQTNVTNGGFWVWDGTTAVFKSPSISFILWPETPDYALLADKEFRSTTITYPDWKHRVDSGFYKSKNVDPTTETAWGRGFAYLAKL